ncbi:exosortase-associated protein EpsI, B-type [Ideonella sp. B508-1]|uniref:exosortase-associated protein EpsI, B-type n=1 Tax=Ideonella sp. B508-1 TaxID=137716 RepID=UPI0003B771AE|nr:exosortase-associated protein EpsI, B-type [Ideonella sp. B508-1]
MPEVRAERSILVRAGLALALMLGSAWVAHSGIPRTRMADQRVARVEIQDFVPLRFGVWRLDTRDAVGVVNPEAVALQDKLYSQILTRVYEDDRGHRMMLMVAYGGDQRDQLAFHYPEICYPAQGFLVAHSTNVDIPLAGGHTLAARRLETSKGPLRVEPLTYWAVVGDRVVRGRLDRNFVQLRYGLHGTIPDGVLVRVSTIGADAPAEFAMQAAFIQEMLAAMTPAARDFFLGQAQR